MTDRCKSCFGYVVWVVTEGGKRMPLDADKKDGALVPHPGDELGDHRGARQGRVVVVFSQPSLDPGVGDLRVVRVLAEDEDHQAEMWRSHFASCPQADQWRKS